MLLEMWTELLLPAEGGEQLEQTMRRWFTDDYRARINGEEIGRAQAEENLGTVRARLTGGRIEVLDQLRDDGRVMGHLLFHFPGATTEAFLVARLAADGRVSSLAEVLRTLT